MISKVQEKLLTATVISVEWERIFLHLDVKIEAASEFDPEGPLEFFAVNGLYQARAKFKCEKKEDNIYSLTVNVTNNGENRCMPTGTYSIYVCQGEYKLAECMFDKSIVGKAQDFSRNFLYGGRGKVYSVTFFVMEGEDTLPFRMYMMPSVRTGLNFPTTKKWRSTIHPIKDLKASFLGVRPLLRNLYRFYSFIYRKNRKKTILFMTEQNDTINSNLKAVSERMIERGLDKDFKLLYSARSAAAEPQGKRSWIVTVKKMAQSGLIFIDDHVPVLDWLKLRDDTKLVQLWHAGAGFKSSGYSRWGHIGCPSPQSCHRQYSYGIAGSKAIAPFFSEVWGINDIQVLPTGMPRMDEYLDENYRVSKTRELYEKYPICKGKKVMLFAPTYRGKNKKDAYYPYDLIDFDRLYKLCGDEYVVLFKMHPWVNVDIEIASKYADKFIDVKTYPNINDLFYITDILVTDYSSNIFEYSLMRKPMLFFAFDKIQYSFSRGFHRDYEEAAPGKVCYTFDELMQAFADRDFQYEKVEQYVEHHFDYIDSHASDRVIDWIVFDKIPQDIKDEIERIQRENERMEALDFTPEVIGEEIEGQNI